MNIGDLFMRVLINDKAFDADLQRTAQKSGDKAGKTLGSRVSGGLKGAFKGSKGDVLGMFGLGAGIGIATVGLSKLVGFMGDAIDAASNLNESVSKVGVVFGESTERVRAWGKTAATSMGLSEQAALEASGTLGNLLLSMGKTSSEAADMSMTMVQLAADLASFNNVDIEEVLMAMRSGLTGEIAPLRRFGVNLTDVTLKQKAMSLGLYKGTGLLDVNAKSAAAYALILEQTTTAQGDFARTSDGLANSQRSLTAQMADLQAEIGEALLPIMLELATVMKNDVIPTLREAVDAGVDLGEILGDVFKSRTDEAKTSVGEFNDALTDFVDDSIDLMTFWDQYTDAVDDQAKAQEKSTEATREGKRAFALVGVAAADATPSVEDLGEAGRKSGRQLKTAAHQSAEAFKDWRDRVIDYARDIVDKAYQVIEDKAALTATNVEAAELRKVIATGKATSEQKARYRELGEQQVGLIIDLAENGVIAGKQVETAVNQIRERLKTATGNERKALLATLSVLSQLVTAAERARIKIAAATELARLGVGSQGLIGGNWGPTGRAHGGRVQAGVPYVVGEKRRELFVPEVNGTILPSVSNDWQGGGPTYNVTINNPEPRAADSDIGRMLRRVAVLG